MAQLDNSSATLNAAPYATGTLALEGATITGGNIINSDNLAFDGISNTLTDVSLDEGLTFGDGGGAMIYGTLVHGANAAFNLGGQSIINFMNDYTLDNATLNCTSATNSGFLGNNSGQTVTLGPNLAVSGKSLAVICNGDVDNETSLISQMGGTWSFDRGQTLTNATGGVLSADGTVSGSAMTINGEEFDNAGALNAVHGAAVTVSDQIMRNTGSMSASSGGTLILAPGAYAAVGSVLADGTGSTVRLQGGSGNTLFTSALSGVNATNGGVVSLETILSNASSTMNAAPYTTGTFLVNGGTISGGAISNSNSLTFNGTSSTLEGVTLDSGLTIADNAGANIARTFSYGTGAAFNLGTKSSLNFEGNYTLDDASINATSLANYGSVTNMANSTLTLGPNLGVTGKYLSLAGAGSITNNTSVVSHLGGNWLVSPSQNLTNNASGLIEADGAVSGSTVRINTAAFSNAGTVEAANGATVYVGTTTATPAVNTGAVMVGAGSTMIFNSTFAQTDAGALDVAYTASSDPNVVVGHGLATVKGAATLGGALNISFVGPAAGGDYLASPGETGTSFDFLTFGTLTNTDLGTLFSNEYTDNGNYFINGIAADNIGASPAVYQLTENGNALHLTLQTLAAPEPSEWMDLALGMLGLTGLAFRARKRSKALPAAN